MHAPFLIGKVNSIPTCLQEKYEGKGQDLTPSRDEDIRQQTQILGVAFDDVLLYQDQCQRGRADGEVVALLRQGLEGASRTTHVDEINGEFVAIDKALARLSAGDLCLILIDQGRAMDVIACALAFAET